MPRRYRQKLVQSTQRTALLTALACARARRPELAVKFFKDPKNYGLFPSRRALHGLLLRVGTDAKTDPSKLALGARPRRRLPHGRRRWR